MIIGDAPVAVDLVQTRRTVNRLGGKIPRAIECQSIVSIEARHRFERRASLKLPKDAFEQRASGLRGHRIADLTPPRVARDPFEAVDRPPMALGALCVEGEP